MMNAQQQQQQQQSNRLQLNFGFQNNPLFGSEPGRVYPTTPSTFPQPFPNSQGQQELWGASGQPQQQQPLQQHSLHQQTQPQSGFNQQGYFANNAYPSSLQQHASLPSPSAAYRTPQGYQDATNGMVHQFAHQNLGGSNQQRAQSPYARGPPSPGIQRPRTGGATTPAQSQYGSHLGTHSHQHQQNSQPSLYDDEPPVKNPERFSTSISNRTKLQTELVSSFFKDSVERARDRNARAQELDQIIKDPQLSDSRKKSKQESLRKSEVNFLRFLRTSEKPQNYQTLKIIGKGAFGEVRLVQRRHDGKVYALKSLIKAEMVRPSSER